MGVDAESVEELGADAYVYGTCDVEGTPGNVIVRVSARDSVHKGDVIHVTTDPTTGRTPTEHERIKATVAIAQKAEEVGLDVFATGEHHNPPFVPSSPTTLLGWIAGEMLISDIAVLQWLQTAIPSWVQVVPVTDTHPAGLATAKVPFYGAAVVGAAIVVTVGYLLKKKPADQPG